MELHVIMNSKYHRNSELRKFLLIRKSLRKKFKKHGFQIHVPCM